MRPYRLQLPATIVFIVTRDAIFEMSAGQVVVEAVHYSEYDQNGASVSAWDIYEDSASAGAANTGYYMRGGTSIVTGTLSGAIARYKVNFDQSGKFYLYVRGGGGLNPASASGDGIMWNIAGASAADGYNQYPGINTSPQHTWRGPNIANSAAYSIDTPGQYNIHIHHRERAVHYDRFIIANVTDAIVSGVTTAGPPESPRTIVGAPKVSTSSGGVYAEGMYEPGMYPEEDQS